MNYYELIYLKRELKAKYFGCKIEQAVTPYKNFLEFFIEGEEVKYRLLFSAAPGNIALFSDTHRGAKKSNTINFFSEIYGSTIRDIKIAESDRWLSIILEQGYSLHFKLFSNQANVFLSKDGVIIESFKDYDAPGEPVPSPKKVHLFEGDIKEKKTKNKLVTLNPMLPRQNLELLIELHQLDSATDEEIIGFVKKITLKMEEEAQFRLLKNGDTTLLSEDVLPAATEKKFETVNDLIAYRYKNYSHNQRLKQKKGVLEKGIERKIKRLKSGLQNLYQAEKGLERAERYEQYGHLLMANAHLDSERRESIQVSDFYHAGEMVEIPLKQDSDLAENAQRYYKKAQSAKKSFEEAEKRIPKMEEEHRHYDQLLKELKSIKSLWDFQDWEKDHSDSLKEFYDSGKKSTEESLPFHTMNIGDYTIWIGKNAKSNDQLVQKAHKEDIWMHARGVPGSHLVIRMGNEKNMPDKQVMLEAASYAAYNSKAKGANLVPVIVTKMKYVRKPKGSPPGAVLVDKEEVEMVMPKKPR